MLMSLALADQTPVAPPSYQRAQARLGPALHMNALTLVTTLHLLMLCRLAVCLAHRRCPPPLPAGPGGAPRTYSEESLLLMSLLRTLWRLSYQDMHDWLTSWSALALACGLPLNEEGQPRIPSRSQQCKRRHAAGAPLHESLFVLTVLQALRRRLIGARDLIIDSAPILAWRGRDPDAAFGHAPAHHPLPLLRGFRVHTLICRGSGLPLFFLLSPANSHDAPFAQRLLAGAVRLYRSVPVSSVWMLPIGVCASLPGFMPCWVPLLLFLGIPNARNAPAYRRPGPKKNSANAAPSNASLVAFFSSFISNVHLCVAGPRWPHRWP